MIMDIFLLVTKIKNMGIIFDKNNYVAIYKPSAGKARVNVELYINASTDCLL